jgi:urease accessory protein
MPIDPGLLTLSQWLSPSYPVGGFAYSHGLETAMAQGAVHDGDSLRLWLEDVLDHGSGRADALFLRRAYCAEAPQDILRLDAQARAFACSGERQREAERQGAAFVRTTNAVWGLDLPDVVLPVAVGRAAALMDIDGHAATSLYLQGFASNLILAAVRLIPLGQTVGQSVLAALGPLCQRVAHETTEAEADNPYSNAFLSDIASLIHETQQPRLFQS